ncbi:preprotein translocase subunit TatC [Halobacteriales archaeon QS_5_70_17]|nr:MAG: preprotein translocase subunit TatC [Halobacteriales archaeon QS_5_70_17]
MSSAIDEDTMRTVAEGRAAMGEMLRAAQKDLQKVAVVFLVGLLGTILYLYYYGWAVLKRDLLSHTEADVFAITPFDVILLQAKIGLIVGAILALPVLIYFARDALRDRGYWPAEKVPRWKLAGLGAIGLVLFVFGIAYGYYVFFPVMFEFLASNAANSGFTPNYSIVKWAEFVLFLTLSFGIAAQLPLIMSALSYSGIVPYETFRDKWRYAVVIIFLFGALFSPPDPFTQVMWAVPLLFLYAFSLFLARTVAAVKRGSADVRLRSELRGDWPLLAGSALTGFAVTYAAITLGVGTYFNDVVRPLLPPVARPPQVPPLLTAVQWLWALPGPRAVLATAAVVAAVAGLLAAAYSVYRSLNAVGGGAAPEEAFAEMEEEEAVDLAGGAMEDGDHEKAQAILDRYDEGSEADAADGTDGESGSASAAAEEGSAAAAGATGAAAGDEAGGGGVFTNTAAGMADAFTEDETTEEEIGGYLYDAQFVLSSLASKSFRLIAVFMIVLAGTFAWLYTGGIGRLKQTFLDRLPTAVLGVDGPLIEPSPLTGGIGALSPEFVVATSQGFDPGLVDIVTLHPVEALVFEIKVATIAGAVATLPLVLYYAWPALADRSAVSGDRGVVFTWSVTTAIALIAGSLFGFLVVAPTVISLVAADAIRHGMVIKYQINGFGWLVFATTVGVGLLGAIPSTMLLFHRGGVVGYSIMRDRWREFTVAVFALAALFSPRGMFTMFLLALPIVAAYGVGLGLLWLYTLGGRRTPRTAGQRAD